MTNRVVDCCSLLNLYTGWGSLAGLHQLDYTWHICEAVLNESEYIREFDQDQRAVMVPLDVRTLIDGQRITSVRPETDAEVAAYVDFAQDIDDGEAQALAIAKHRHFTLLTDDGKATRLAHRPDVNVATITTVHVLKEWAERTKIEADALRHIVRRIQVLARFAPRRDSPDFAWWQSHI